MSIRPGFLVIAFGVVLASAAGCAYGEVRQVIRAQFASELHCPEVQLQHRALWYASDNPNQYKVTGCGTVRTYTCTGDEGLVSYDKPACTWVNGDADAPEAHKNDAAAGDDLGEGASSGGDQPAAPAAAPAKPEPKAPAAAPAAAPAKPEPKAPAAAPAKK